MRYFLLSVVFFLLLDEVKAQAPLTSKCEYYSEFDMGSYLSTLDSLVTKIKKKKNETVQVIGSRRVTAATIMIVTRRQHANKGYYYDVKTRQMKIVEGKVFNTWLENLRRDSSFLHTAKADPQRLPSHEHSFFVSFKYPQVALKEICYSQLLSDTKRPFGRELMSSLLLFK
jgi:hypothetical protein